MNKWKETLSIILISASFISLILIIQPNQIKISEFKTRIPKTTTEHYLINTSHFFKKLVFNELFVHQDELVIAKIKELLSKKTKSKTNLSELSIDFFAPLEVFQFKKEDKSYTVLKFKISNSKTFDESQKKKSKELIFRNEQDGYWVLGELKSKKSLFKKIIVTNSFEYTLKNDESKFFISTFQNSNLEAISSVEIKDNEIKIELKRKNHSSAHTCLKPDGFHFSTNVHSDQLAQFNNDEILKFIHWKELNYISLNYYGLNFIDDSKIPAMPQIEMYLEYETAIKGNSMISNLINKYNLPFNNQDTSGFILGNQSIRVKQIDTNKFLVSTINKTHEFTQTKFNPLLSGDPKNIVKITNAGWKSLFLELLSGFKASKNLFESTDKVSTFQNRNGSQVICLTFKKKEDVLHSFLKFVLNFQ